MTALLAGLAGACVVTGVLLAGAGLRRAPQRPSVPHPRRGVSRRWSVLVRSPQARWRALAAGVAAAGVWLVSGLPAAGLIVGLTILGLPVLLSTSRVAARAIDRVEAVEEWARRLADVLTVGVGLEQAIAATVRSCPTPIRTEVAALSARLAAHWPTEQALRAFADELDDASADLIVATLILGARRRGPGLARVLTAVADSVAADVTMRRQVEAERAKPRTTARAVTLITLGVVAFGALNGTYLAPYTTPLGQLVLTVITLGFAAALGWMRAITLSTPDPRLFTAHPAPPALSPVNDQAMGVPDVVRQPW